MVCLLLLGGQASCIKDDDVSCPPGTTSVNLSFDFQKEDSLTKTKYDLREVKLLDVYVFDANDVYLETLEDPSPELDNSGYRLTAELPAGEYTFITWGNLRDYYCKRPGQPVAGETRLDGMKFLYDNPQARDTVTCQLEPLYFSSLKHATVEGEETNLRSFLVRDTYTIHFTIEGLPGQGDRYALLVSDMNKECCFDNSFCEGGQLCYMQELFNQGDLLTATITKIRLSRERNPMLKLFDETRQTTVLEANLVDLILQLEKHGIAIDFDKMYEFDLHLTFGEENGRQTVSVSVNNWIVDVYDIDVHP